MQTLIPKMYKTYGNYVNQFRSFPLKDDGCKPVERRVLLSTYEIARDKFVKSARIDGHCLHGTTKIKLADGNIKSIEELYNENYEDFYIYAFDIDNNKPIITKVDCVKLTRFEYRLLEIKTESGIVICTYDHKWLLKTGEYREAEYLNVGDELESIKFGITDDKGLFDNTWTGISNYEVVKSNNECYLSHHLADEYNYNINLEDGFVRHHKNLNKLDNRPTNIERLSLSEHSILHIKNWIYNEGGIDILKENGKNVHKNNPHIIEKLVDFTKSKLDNDPLWCSKNAKKFWNDISIDEKEKFCKNISNKMLEYYEKHGTKNISNKIKSYWANSDSENVKKHREINRNQGIKYSHKLKSNHSIKILKTIKILLDKKLELNEENFNSNRLYPSSPLYNKILKYFNSYEEVINQAIKYNNHTVLDIKVVEYDNTPVYDLINSEKYHNFSVIFDDNTAIISSNCIGHYHPHGTSYGSIVQLVKQGLLDPQGNFGNNLGVDPSPPAAMRYTETRLSSFAAKNSFSLINFIDRQESELDDEPIFLPSMFPVCLLGTENTQGIGFGYRTYIPCYRIDDLKNRLLWLLGLLKEQPIIEPICSSHITSSNADLVQLLTTGKASIKTQGIIAEDRRNCKVIVKSWPEGKRFGTILSKFQKELDNRDIGFADLSDGETGNNIVFQVLKQRNRDKIYASFVKKLNLALKGSISFEIMVSTLDGKVELCSVDNFLLQCYNNYKNITKVMLNSNLEKTRASIQENLDLDKLKEPLRDYLASKRKDDPATRYKLLTKQSTLSIERVKELMRKYRLAKLLTINTDITGYKETETQIQEHLNKLSDFVLEKYGEL